MSIAHELKFSEQINELLNKKEKKYNRPSWNKYFMDMCELASKRSTCIRRKVGCVIVKDNQVLATGYNGAPSHTEHCLNIGCIREKLHIPSGTMHEKCRGAHSETNAISQAAKQGTSIEGSTLYCTTYPCSMCAKSIINAGIIKIYYKEGYPDELSKTLLEEAGIEVIHFNE